MQDDFKLIIHKLDRTLKSINIYAISDLHIGAKECNIKKWEQFKKAVLSQPNNYVVIAGDMMNNAIKSSVSNVYDDVMRPREQKEWLVNQLKDIKERILCVVSGNHERRNKDVDDNPLYDVCCKLDIEDLYRDNAAFVKINVGERVKQRTKQVCYTLFVHHGASKNKMDKFATVIDGVDIVITGHIHEGMIGKRSKIVIDDKNECVRFTEYVVFRLISFLEFGGYALNAMYQPTSSDSMQILRLNGEYKKITTEW